MGNNEFAASDDPLFDDAAQLVIQQQRASISIIQRGLRIGFARSERLLRDLERVGIVSVSSGSNQRSVVTSDYAKSEYLQFHLKKAQQFVDKYHETIDLLTPLVSSAFQIPECSQCANKDFRVIDVNPYGTGISLECSHCKKSTWITTDHEKSGLIKELFEAFDNSCMVLRNLPKSIAITGEYGSLMVQSNEIKIDGSYERKAIPKPVKLEVWQRDKGQCVQCGSNENLEYDHIIPIAKGGANTTRNIQLLCEKCNRSKGTKIQ